MSLRDAIRREWIAQHQLDEEQFENMVREHHDERAIRCPQELINFDSKDEYITRQGNGFVLGDGAWYDPITQQFSYFETVEDPSGEVRFDLGVDYKY